MLKTLNTQSTDISSDKKIFCTQIQSKRFQNDTSKRNSKFDKFSKNQISQKKINSSTQLKNSKFRKNDKDEKQFHSTSNFFLNKKDTNEILQDQLKYRGFDKNEKFKEFLIKQINNQRREKRKQSEISQQSEEDLKISNQRNSTCQFNQQKPNKLYFPDFNDTKPKTTIQEQINTKQKQKKSQFQQCNKDNNYSSVINYPEQDDFEGLQRQESKRFFTSSPMRQSKQLYGILKTQERNKTEGFNEYNINSNFESSQENQEQKSKKKISKLTFNLNPLSEDDIQQKNLQKNKLSTSGLKSSLKQSEKYVQYLIEQQKQEKQQTDNQTQIQQNDSKQVQPNLQKYGLSLLKTTFKGIQNLRLTPQQQSPKQEFNKQMEKNNFTLFNLTPFEINQQKKKIYHQKVLEKIAIKQQEQQQERRREEGQKDQKKYRVLKKMWKDKYLNELQQRKGQFTQISIELYQSLQKLFKHVQSQQRLKNIIQKIIKDKAECLVYILFKSENKQIEMDPLKLENNLESVLKSSKDYQKYKKLLITDLELQINLVIQEIEQHLLSKDLFLLENIVTNINQQQFDYKLREAQRRLELKEQLITPNLFIEKSHINSFLLLQNLEEKERPVYAKNFNKISQSTRVMGKTMDNLLQKYGKIDQNALEQQVMEYRLQDLEKKATNFIEQ